MFHLLRKRRSKRANKKSQGSRVAKVSPVGSMEGESSPKDPAYLAKRRVWKLEHKLDLPRIVAEDLAAAVGPDADKPADIVVLADDCEAMHAWRWAELKLKLERLANVLDAADHAGGFELRFTNPKDREVHRITSAAQVKRLFESVVPHGEKKALRARLQPLLDGREIGAGRDRIVLVLTSGRPEDVISDAFHKLVAGKHANVFLTLVVYSDEAPWNGMTECEWTAYYRDALRDISGVAVCGFHTWRVRNAAGVAGRSGSVASDRGNAWLVRALLGGKFARHRGSQNLYYLSHPAP